MLVKLTVEPDVIKWDNIIWPLKLINSDLPKVLYGRLKNHVGS